MCGVAGTFSYRPEAPPVDQEALLHTRDHMRTRGMFAFAIWDAEQHGLFLARDQFGIKPLYLADASLNRIKLLRPLAPQFLMA